MSASRRLVILLIVSALTPLAEPDLAACLGPGEREARRDLLAAALQRPAGTRSRLEQIAAAQPQDDLAKLAAVLLEEWNLPKEDPKLGLPRLISVPKLDESEIKAALPNLRAPLLVIANPVVDREGFVTSCSVLRPSDHQLINEKVWEACLQARFRPARDASGYIVSRKSNIQFYWHPEL